MTAPGYEYILYIDEAGDDGLAKVRPIDVNGSSEWLVISGYLIRKSNEGKCVEWLDEIVQDINCRSRTIHFRKLSPRKQLRATELLARLPSRGFVVCSNKKNMRGYKNSRAASAGGKQWFYNWLLRVLLERVTEFCASDRNGKPGEDQKLKIIFSNRGGHSYGQTKAYFEKLRFQHRPYLNKRKIDFRFISYRLIDYLPHYMDPGLQFADILASAFYLAINTEGSKWTPEPAKQLSPIICRDTQKNTRDVGLVLQPDDTRSIGLSSKQSAVFLHYGFTSFELAQDRGHFD